MGIAALFFAALGISGVLYARSQAADFRRHAQTIEALGALRHTEELLSKQVLAARFGLLNQYDPVNASESELSRGAVELRRRAGEAVGLDGRLGETLGILDDAVGQQRQTVERFKAENSVLRNSVYYFPTVARELAREVEGRSGKDGSHRGAVAIAIRESSEAALVYNLVGDETARAAYAAALAELEARRAYVPRDLSPSFDSLLTHANVIRVKQPAVDGWVKRAMARDVGAALDDVERAYHERFEGTVARSSGYRKILYCWSLFLAIAVGVASMQLRRLYADLERRVAERTAELAKALGALWGEMKLARKIQEALVPSAPMLAGCDVAAAMKPAVEVGGDYYDVVAAGGREWILIGDVSGHGVSAGLVMMMCHTAVRTVLRSDPEVTPEELLARINTVLTENIRQLGEDKYMTLTAFRRDLDGTISFAGAHQDVFVYRAEADSVEVYETEGVWLGLKERIAESLRSKKLKLGRGDVMVVHTDGITEATREGALFDNAGLRQVLGSSRGKTAAQILGDTFRALEGFELADDATLVVIRQVDAPA